MGLEALTAMSLRIQVLQECDTVLWVELSAIQTIAVALI